MGFLSSLLGAAAPVVGNLIAPGIGGAIGGAVGGLIGGKNGGAVQSGTQTVTQQQQLDPRIQAMLFGDGTDANKGLLAQYQALGQQPQNANTAAFGGAAQNFLGNQGSGILGQLQSGATGLLNSSIKAPQASATTIGGVSAGPATTIGSQAPVNGEKASILWNQGARVGAPAQNGIDLTGAYNRFINGDAGANPYLTNALQAGVDQTTSAYNRNLGNLTDTLQKRVLPGIRSNAILAGQYGSSRQGVAEGNALSDFTRQANDANLALGQANSANTLNAQAQAFNQGQDRSLAATQGLGAQQYGVASQESAQQQQAQLANQAANQQAQIFNAGQVQSANQFNNQLGQQAALANQGALNQNAQFNAAQQQQATLANQGALNQTGLANLQAQLGTNSLNSGNQATGLSGLSGLLSQVYGYGQNQDNYGLNRASQLNGLLAPYLSANSSSTTSQPTYYNPGGQAIGGLLGGAALGGMNLSNLFGSNQSLTNFNVSPGTAPVNTGLLSDTSWLNNLRVGG